MFLSKSTKCKWFADIWCLFENNSLKVKIFVRIAVSKVICFNESQIRRLNVIRALSIQIDQFCYSKAVKSQKLKIFLTIKRKEQSTLEARREREYEI